MASKDNNQDNKQGTSTQAPRKRGFAAMDPEQQRLIAAEGGRAAHEKGTAHEFTSEEARRAGAMSHKNDRNHQSHQSSQSGSSGSRNLASAGNQAGGEQAADDDGRGSPRGSKSKRQGGRSRS